MATDKAGFGQRVDAFWRAMPDDWRALDRLKMRVAHLRGAMDALASLVANRDLSVVELAAEIDLISEETARAMEFVHANAGSSVPAKPARRRGRKAGG